MLVRDKVLEYFNADVIKQPINIVGCGAIGSHLAEELIRIGVTSLHLWDFDMVEPHNITNQMFFATQIGMSKVDAVEQLCTMINPDVKITKHSEGIKPPYALSGIVFLCVDNIDLRREIVKQNQYNPNVSAFFDFRMRLTDGQCYFGSTQELSSLTNLLASMDFTHEEAKASTPVSACGTELSVIYTVKAIVSVGVHNFITYIQTCTAKPVILIDMQSLTITTV